jgi:outer membrane protein assembly factor BamB
MHGLALTDKSPCWYARQCRAQHRRTRALILSTVFFVCLIVAIPCFGQGTAPTTDAEILFRFPVGGVITAGPSLGDGRAWLLSDAKTLYILTVDGVAIGKKSLAERRSPWIVCDPYGRAVVSLGASTLALVNKAGQEVWRIDVGAAPQTTPVFASDGRLFVAAADSVSAYAPNGKQLWKAPLTATPGSNMVIGPAGGPAFGLADGRLLLYSPHGGEPRSVQLGSKALAVAAGPESLVAALENGMCVVLSVPGAFLQDGPEMSENGAPPKPVRLDARPLAVASSRDGFYALGTDGTLVAMNMGGNEVWRQKLRLDGGAAYLLAFDGRIVVLTRTSVRSFGTDGSIYRTLALTNAATMPIVASNGAVFAGGADWILYAYRFERPLTALSPAVIPAIDIDDVESVAREEALWSSASWSDDTAMERMRDIEKSLKSGTIDGDAEQTMLYLASVAFGRMEAPFGAGAVNSGPTPRGPLPRMTACSLLGQMGLPQAIHILVEVFRLDPDPAVRSAAALAVAAIGLDPGGKALEAFALAAERQLDERVASAIVDAISGLYRASGALENRSGLLALVRIAGGEYSRELGTRAGKALKSLSSAK